MGSVGSEPLTSCVLCGYGPRQAKGVVCDVLELE